MSLRDLCKDIYRSVSGDGYYDWADLVPLDGTLRDALAGSDSLKTDLVVDPAIPINNQIRLAVVLSDFTSLYFKRERSSILLGIDDDTHDTTCDLRQTNLPEGVFGPTGSLAGFSAFREQAKARKLYFLPLLGGATELFDDLGSLMESGRLLVRPSPALEVFLPQSDKEPVWLNIDPNTPGEAWIVRETESQSAIPLKLGPASEGSERSLGTLLLPYLKGIEFGVLSRILDDEQDHLAELRLSLKNLISQAKSQGKDLKELFEDTVVPATKRVERRLRNVSQMHSVKIAGATLATGAVSLTAMLSGGIAASIGAFLSAAGIVGVSKELADFWKAKAEVQELPFYMLWRLNQNRQA